jgi:hypothetical protein
VTFNDDRRTCASKQHDERPILPVGEDIESPMIFVLAVISLTITIIVLGMFGGVSIFG